MQKKKVAIDCGKLLGFANLANERNGAIDFKNKTVDAQIGAKVGAGESCTAADLHEMGVMLASSRPSKG